MSTPRTLSLFAGPGGMCEAARLLGLDLGILGVELEPNACATARAAGHQRLQADVTGLRPEDFPGVTGLIVTPPCPTFSKSGLRSGLGDDYQHALDAITALGAEYCGYHCPDQCWQSVKEQVTDPRTALVVEAARWAFGIDTLEWIVCEQVPGVEYLWEDFAAELMSAGWEYVNVVRINAQDYGAGARRERAFLYARRLTPCTQTVLGSTAPTVSFADVAGWEPGHKVRTRNNRRPTGGNLFDADGPSWCLTGKARSWERDADGARFEANVAGALQGFPFDYPWQGSRSSQFQQAGDVVSPLAGAAVLGTVHGIDWRPLVKARAAELARGPLSEAVDVPASFLAEPVQLAFSF